MFKFDKDVLTEVRIDNTKRERFVTCPRKSCWADLMGLQPLHGSSALRAGGTWHAIMKGYYSAVKKYGWENREKLIEEALITGKAEWDNYNSEQTFYEDYRSLEVLTEVFFQYLHHFDADKNIIEVVETEQSFAMEIAPTAEEQRKYFQGIEYLPKMFFTGRIDLQVKMNGMPWFEEFKTTGQNLDIQAMRLSRSAQMLGYGYATPQVLGYRPEGCLAVLVMFTARKNKEGVYGKTTIDFKRVPQIFNEGDLAAWRDSYMWTVSQIIRSIQANNFPMLHDSCFNFNTSCAYSQLCMQNRDPWDTDTSGYVIRHWDVEDE